MALSFAAPSPALAQVRTQEIEPSIATSPNDPSSGELVEEPKKYDGSSVRFTGEAIGEALERGDMAWLHLNDDAYYLRNIEEGAKLGGYNSGMPVWTSRGLTDKIGFYGDYRHEGDVVTVRGVFNAACPEHGGDMDIHAESLDVDTPGHPVSDPIDPRKLLGAFLLVPMGLLFWWIDGQLTVGMPGQTRRSVLFRRSPG